MTAVILEGFLFLALVFALVALVYYAVREYSPLGLRLRQERNFRELVDDAARTCPTHGPQAAETLIRVDGVLVCPHCFQRVLKDDIDRRPIPRS